MAHGHDVYNTDERFVIDPSKRTITQKSGKNKLIRGDHNSECFAFEIPRYVDGHDMSLCNSVKIHYINQSSNKSDTSTGPYEVRDLTVNPDDNETVIFSWKISRNVTKYAGTVNFSVEFRCTSGSIVEYEWNTDIFNSITISDRIINDSSEIVEEYVDILEQWRNELVAAGGSNASVFIDTETGKSYKLSVVNGSLTMSEVIN